MSKIRCIIVEDEPLAAKVLSDYIGEVPFLELKGTFKDAILATEFLRDQTIDLIFLDIHLPKLKGMAFLRTLTHPPAVIVTTAYHQYAVEGFELSVTDYLLKPIEFERFLVAVNKVRAVATAPAGKTGSANDREEISPKGNWPLTSSETSAKAEYLFLNVQKKKVKILFAELLYIESQREYVKIVTTNKEYLSKMSTHEIESLLPRNLFKRIHRSFIVSLDKIQAFTAEEVEVNGVVIPVGREYRHSLGDL
jgi:two-component system, LytTR family, response regulator